MRAIDTNVLVRLITRDDPKQVESAETFVARGAWVSLLVVAETTWVLSAAYDLKRDQIATAIRMLLDHDHLTLQDADVIQSALETFVENPSVGFSDCLVLHIASKAGHLPLGTFDKALSKVHDAERL